MENGTMGHDRHEPGSASSSTRYLRDGADWSAPLKRRGRTGTILLSLLAVLLIVGSAVSAAVLIRNGRRDGPSAGKKPATKYISAACSKTFYQSLCLQSLADFPGTEKATSVNDLVHLSFNMTLQRLNRALFLSSELSVSEMEPMERSAYSDCIELLDDSVNALSRSLTIVSPGGTSQSGASNTDVMTWLSAALTNHDTCTDGLTGAGEQLRSAMQEKLANLAELISNCLAIFAATGGNDFSGIPIGNKRRLMAEEEELPAWVGATERRLLQLPPSAIQADIIVSKDGNGTCTTITEAIKQIPEYSLRRIVIYVKAGRYEEDLLKVGRRKTNVMFIGDGKSQTFITGGKSIFDNITTFGTAAFAATGAGFIARDITFENWAGPSMHQAVALRIGADHAVVYRCNIIGYQDTLYVHSNRQFFRECDIYGTVDFIFGNAAVVFQNCSLYARKPLVGQKNTVTAQNRKDPNQNTGISIHACRILATSDLEAVKYIIPTYLGRPWKLYSRTVYMMSYIGDHVQPRGWLEWNATFALDSLYYGEYMNYGPASGVSQRVTWPGYHVISSVIDATKFTVGQFIYGASWLPSTGVAFLAGLSE